MTATAGIKGEPSVLDLHGACIRRTDLSGTNLANANFSGADCTGVNFRGANFRGAVLKGTILRGADLADAKNLSWEQLAEAVMDETTVLPAYLHDRAASSASANR
jgi:uncharacterized protein YjbI with pentapeptide repeats